MPIEGPFEVQRGKLTRSTLFAIGFGLLLMGIGAGFAWYAVTQAQEVLRVRAVWIDGVDMDDQPGFGGEVTTNNFVFNDYELEVVYLHPEAGPVTFEAEFFTFFTGPDDATPMTVRALADDPTSAVTSWQADSWVHGAIWAAIIAALSLLMLGGGGLIAINGVKEHGKALRLARIGHLTDATVVAANRVENGKTVSVTLDVELATGDRHRLTYNQGPQDPVFLDHAPEEPPRVVVLAAKDGSEARLVEADGYPLRLG